MEDKNELNDIILNKGGKGAINKKVILAVATLVVILIAVVVLMNSLSSKGSKNLPQPAAPTQAKSTKAPIINDEPLFEDVAVIEEAPSATSLEQIAQKLKEESKAKEELAPAVKSEPTPKPEAKTEPKPEPAPKPEAKTEPKTGTQKSGIVGGSFYIQVGSFTKEPNKKATDNITKNGYNYTLYTVTQDGKVLNKLLIGPYPTRAKANEALGGVKNSIEKNAFILKP